MAKRVWVTGSKGFIGSSLVKHLNQHTPQGKTSFEVFEFAGDVLNSNALRQSLEFASPDVVIHLAAISHTHLCEKDRPKAQQVNVTGTENVFKALVSSGNPKPVHFIFPSTAQVYKTKNSGSIDENSEIEPVNFYAETKLASENFLKSSAKNLSGQVTIARLFNHVHHTQQPITFLASVYQQLLASKNNGNLSPEIKVGNLNLIRDIGSVFDLMSAFTKMAEFQVSQAAAEVFNIGSGIGRRLGDVANALCAAMEIQANFLSVPELMRATDPAQMVANINKFKNVFSWAPSAVTHEDLIRDFLKKT